MSAVLCASILIADELLTSRSGWGAGFIQRHWVLLGFLGLIALAILLPIVYVC